MAPRKETDIASDSVAKQESILSEPPCSDGNHVVYWIGTESVKLNDCEKKLAEFTLKIDDFNTRGMRMQVSHPGRAYPLNFCLCCGASLAGVELPKLTWNS